MNFYKLWGLLVIWQGVLLTSANPFKQESLCDFNFYIKIKFMKKCVQQSLDITFLRSKVERLLMVKG